MAMVAKLDAKHKEHARQHINVALCDGKLLAAVSRLLCSANTIANPASSNFARTKKKMTATVVYTKKVVAFLRLLVLKLAHLPHGLAFGKLLHAHTCGQSATALLTYNGTVLDHWPSLCGNANVLR